MPGEAQGSRRRNHPDIHHKKSATESGLIGIYADTGLGLVARQSTPAWSLSPGVFGSLRSLSWAGVISLSSDLTTLRFELFA